MANVRDMEWPVHWTTELPAASSGFTFPANGSLKSRREIVISNGNSVLVSFLETLSGYAEAVPAAVATGIIVREWEDMSTYTRAAATESAKMLKSPFRVMFPGRI